ncbi:NeuD/PglB/VioB family sugar acetyltransferase [Flavobacterium sp. 3HN19-14]|uniref:NeuD/PglB/VioB family sugar acetyltransferase n=1 Tax=Flavobacterium sp. 3HN19-14 TaxID=3448133 RepID=UPI003EE1C3A1
MVDTPFNKKDLYMIGAGGLSRELESWMQKSNLSSEYALKGYLDDDAEALKGIKNDFNIIGRFFNDGDWKGKNLLLAIASPEIKQKALDLIRQNDTVLLSMVHEFSVIGNNSHLGIGYVLCPFVVVSCNVTLGDCVTVNSGSQIGHDVIVGNFTSIMANVDIGGGAVIGNNVFIGSNAVVLPGVKIPDNTRIGAGAVVLRTIKKPGTYFGNPANKIF